MSNIVIKASKKSLKPKVTNEIEIFFPTVLEFMSQKTKKKASKPHLLVFVQEKWVTISYSRSNSIQFLLLYLSGILNKLHPQHWLPSPPIIRDLFLCKVAHKILLVAGCLFGLICLG